MKKFKFECGLIIGNFEMVHIGENENIELFLFFLNVGGFNSGKIGSQEDDEDDDDNDGANFGKGQHMSSHSAGLHAHSMQRGQLNCFLLWKL